MAIQRLNRLLRQFQVEEQSVTTENFLNLCDSIAALTIFSTNSRFTVNIQFDTAQLSGDLPQVRTEIKEIEDGTEVLSMSASFTVNQNPIKQLSITISTFQFLFSINGNNFSKDEAETIIPVTEKYFKKKKTDKDKTIQTQTQPQVKTQDFQYLPGPFAPLKIPDSISEKKVFIIMSFQSEYRDAFFVAIEPTLKEMGFDPIRIDQIQHNNTVTSEILKEIETSAFVVADLTGERPNVYYEVGWAHRAGKEVVLLARKDTAVHFDVAAINRIEYKDYTELRDALKKRVKAICERLGIKIT